MRHLPHPHFHSREHAKSMDTYQRGDEQCAHHEPHHESHHSMSQLLRHYLHKVDYDDM
jgi:hypothetical protein